MKLHVLSSFFHPLQGINIHLAKKMIEDRSRDYMNARRVAKVQTSPDFPLLCLILQTTIKLCSDFQIKVCVRLIRLVHQNICIGFIKHNLK